MYLLVDVENRIYRGAFDAGTCHLSVYPWSTLSCSLLIRNHPFSNPFFLPSITLAGPSLFLSLNSYTPTIVLASMFSPRIPLTLFVCLTLILSLSEAKLQQRDHVNLNRVVKKRIPSPQVNGNGSPFGPVAGAAAVPSSSSATSTSVTSVSDSSTLSGSRTESASSTSSALSVCQFRIYSGETNISITFQASIVSTNSTLSTSQSTSSSTTSSTSSVASTTSQPLNLSPVPVAEVPASTAKSTVTRTQSVGADSSTGVPALQSGAAKTKSTTLTVLIIVASSIGGVAILWTIFRKWKLGRSSKFDERLQPIDWQPTNPDDGIIPSHRRSPSSASSFHSGTGHGHSANRAVAYAIPDHDFTAPPSHSAPIGGYADLARGSATQPPMQEHLTRGPSLSRTYDMGVPLHHQVGHGNHDPYDYNGAVNPRY